MLTVCLMMSIVISDEILGFRMFTMLYGVLIINNELDLEWTQPHPHTQVESPLNLKGKQVHCKTEIPVALV